MSNLTSAQIQARWAQIQSDFAQRGTTNRAGTYFQIARLYSDIGTPEALRASRQIMMQAQITSYSGAIGAAGRPVGAPAPSAAKRPDPHWA